MAGAIACGKGKNSSTVDLIKTVATEARTKVRVEMSVKMAADQPTPDDLALSSKWDNTADAISQLRKEAQEVGVLERSSVNVLSW